MIKTNQTHLALIVTVLMNRIGEGPNKKITITKEEIEDANEKIKHLSITTNPRPDLNAFEVWLE